MGDDNNNPRATVDLGSQAALDNPVVVVVSANRAATPDLAILPHRRPLLVPVHLDSSNQMIILWGAVAAGLTATAAP